MGNVPIMALPRNTVFNSCKADAFGAEPAGIVIWL